MKSPISQTLLSLLCAAALPAAGSEKPNIVLIFANDLGYGDLQGFKFGAWEGGHRVPFLAKWPGKIPAGSTSDQLLNLVDLVATFAEITGCELAPGEGIDSVTQLASLTGEPAQPVRETMVIFPNSPKLRRSGYGRLHRR